MIEPPPRRRRACLCLPGALPAAPVVREIHGHVASVGQRANCFDDKLLTADDLGGDQDYPRGTDRQLGDPAAVLGDPTLTLHDLFAPASRADVRLSFDCAVTECQRFREPVRLNDPQHDDLIFLDLGEGRWFGQLYLSGVGDLSTGVYDHLSGSVDRLVAVDEPGSLALAGLALVGPGALRRRRIGPGRFSAAPGCRPTATRAARSAPA